MKVRTRMALAAAVAVALVAAGCSGGATTTDAGAPVVEVPRSGGSIAFALQTDPNGLDPMLNAWDPSGMEVAGALYDTLTAWADDGTVKPYLAESMTPNADFTEWTIKLRPDVVFHDGTPLDADLMVRVGNEFVASPVTGPPSRNIKSSTRIDDLTLVVAMHRPWSSYPALLTGQGGVAVAHAQLDDPEAHSHPVGTGPFKLQTWDFGRQMRLVRHDSYWRKDERGTRLPYLDAVTFTIQPDLRQSIAALRSGDLDIFHAQSATGSTELDQLAADGRFSVEHDDGPTPNTFVLLNTMKEPLNDVRVRRAMAHATDIQTLADTNGWAPERLATTLYGPSSYWYADVDFPRYDLDKAKALIAEYQAETGKDVSLVLSNPQEKDTPLAQQLVDMWGAAGIKASLDVIDVRRAVIYGVTGQFDAQLFVLFGEPDPDMNWYFWHSSTVAPLGELSINYSHLADPEIDAALDAGRVNDDPAVRKQAYARLQERFAELVPYIWLTRQEWTIATHKKVRQARNVTLPDGSPAQPYVSGVFRLTETWLAS